MNNNKLLLIGDFNAHIHISDGGAQNIHKTNKKGKLLLNLVESLDLHMMNMIQFVMTLVYFNW